MFKMKDFENNLTVERILGCLPGDNADLYEDDADDLLEQITDADAMHPAAVCVKAEITKKEGNTICLGDTKITASLFGENCHVSDTVYACLATSGRELDRFAASLDDPMLSYLQGVVMNICLDDGILMAAEKIAEENPGKKLMMVKPGIEGVCEFTEQMGILSLLGDTPAELEVDVKEHGFLNPAYSATALLFVTDGTCNYCQDWSDDEEKKRLMHELNVIAGHV